MVVLAHYPFPGTNVQTGQKPFEIVSRIACGKFYRLFPRCGRMAVPYGYSRRLWHAAVQKGHIQFRDNVIFVAHDKFFIAGKFADERRLDIFVGAT